MILIQEKHVFDGEDVIEGTFWEDVKVVEDGDGALSWIENENNATTYRLLPLDTTFTVQEIIGRN